MPGMSEQPAGPNCGDTTLRSVFDADVRVLVDERSRQREDPVTGDALHRLRIRAVRPER